MKFFLLFVMVFVLAGCTSTQQVSHQQLITTEAVTAPDVTEVPDFTGTPDYLKMRETIGWSKDYLVKCENGRPLSKMIMAMNDAQWQAAADLGLAWLNTCPVDIRAHYYTGISLSELRRDEQADHHFRWSNGLMDSVMASGNGKSPKTAFKVISISEEYDVISILGLSLKRQSLVSTVPMCDLLVTIDEQGNEVSLYFNPAAHFARLQKMFD